MKKLGLLPRIAIAIVLGILIGFIAPQCLGELCATFNAIYGQFLGFMIPMIIIGFVVPAIGDIGARAGRLLVGSFGLWLHCVCGTRVVHHRFNHISGAYSRRG